jgi:hypothetical protein
MTLNRNNTRVFHRTLYAGLLKTITLIKRKDDQAEGTQTSYVVFQCRRSSISKTGEPIQGDMTVDHRTVWHIPRTEMIRIGVRYFSALDKIVEDHDDMNQPLPQANWRYWQPEATTVIDTKLFQNSILLYCVRRDPPGVDNLGQ